MYRLMQDVSVRCLHARAVYVLATEMGWAAQLQQAEAPAVAALWQSGYEAGSLAAIDVWHWFSAEMLPRARLLGSQTVRP